MEQIKLASVEECTGCMVCTASCNKGAISFVEKSNSLHTYPVIDTSVCVQCKKCISICPPLNFDKTINEANHYKTRSYCAWHIDENIRRKATSGGVGSALAETAIKLGYRVVGASFDDKWNLSHKIAHNESEVANFAGSKYLLSEISQSLIESVNVLNNGEKIFFIGTPCQCEAIKNLTPISKKHNLLTCSIICHGVNSPIVWKDYVNYLENRYKSKLISYNFRSKKRGWGKMFIDYSFSNGKRIAQKARCNQFHVWFGYHYIQRLSCFNCKFRTKERFTDFVIGDFWGIERVLPDLNTYKGISVLIVNSGNADEFIKCCDNIKLVETNLDETYKVLKGFTETQSQDIKQKEILNNHKFAMDYRANSFHLMTKSYPVQTLLKVIIDCIFAKFKSNRNG